MTLPITGPMTIGMVAAELGISATGLHMNDARVRALAGRPSSTIALSDMRGKGNASIWVASTSGAGTNGSYHYVNYGLSPDVTTSGWWISGGAGISVARTANTQFRFNAPGGYGHARSGTFRVAATPNGGGISATVDRWISLTESRVNVNCHCQCDCTCFPEGSMVLMADGSLKEITQIKPGDWVQGPTMAWEVDYLHVARLAHRKMLAFSDRSLAWSDEHLFWARENGKQWWWCANPDNWRLEVDIGLVKGLYDNYSHFTSADVEFAHVDDVWRRRDVMDVTEADSCTPDTKVYLPIPGANSDHMCFVNGYLVTASTDQWTMDYEKFVWDEANALRLRKK